MNYFQLDIFLDSNHAIERMLKNVKNYKKSCTVDAVLQR